MLSQELEAYQSSGKDALSDCFDSVLFPLLDELLRTDAFLLDSAGMDESRMRASGLLCKLFLHFLPRMVDSKELPGLWDRVLGYIQRYFEAGQSDYLV